MMKQLTATKQLLTQIIFILVGNWLGVKGTVDKNGISNVDHSAEKEESITTMGNTKMLMKMIL